MSKGITLIELLVGIACFSIIIVLVTGIFVTALGAKKQMKELSVLQDEARYIMDYMSREIRVAEIVNNGKGDSLEIKTIEGNVKYKFKNNNIERKNQILNTIKVITNDSYFNIDKTGQPKVEIYMKLQKDNNKLEVQTTISSRYYE